MFIHAGRPWFIGTSRAKGSSHGTAVSLMLMCCSWKWISKRVLTGWDVKGKSNVVQNVG